MIKRPKTDVRLDWRDPNMPVLRYGKFGNFVGTKEVAPQDIQRYYAAKLAQIGSQMPDWKDDPTYDLKKKKKIVQRNIK